MGETPVALEAAKEWATMVLVMAKATLVVVVVVMVAGVTVTMVKILELAGVHMQPMVLAGMGQLPVMAAMEVMVWG
jgi:hypothetical protein